MFFTPGVVMAGGRTRNRIFGTIVDYKRLHNGLSPTLKEIAAVLGLSRSTVRYHVLMLEKEQRIRIIKGWRFEVPGEEWDWDEV